jgi:hypothetical protein
MTVTVELWRGATKLAAAKPRVLTTAAQHITLRPQGRLAAGTGYRVVVRISGVAVLNHRLSIR